MDTSCLSPGPHSPKSGPAQRAVVIFSVQVFHSDYCYARIKREKRPPPARMQRCAGLWLAPVTRIPKVHLLWATLFGTQSKVEKKRQRSESNSGDQSSARALLFFKYPDPNPPTPPTPPLLASQCPPCFDKSPLLYTQPGVF